MEEYAYVIDYMPQGLPTGGYSKREPLCYAVGETEFKLFELVPKANATIVIGERVFVGKDGSAEKRDHIDHVKKRISYSELTRTAQTELEFVITDIVLKNPQKYVAFYNNAEAISLRKHMLEELPGLGKKTMTSILDERKKSKFTGFDDLALRVPMLKGPEKNIVKRIILELSDPERKHYIFVSR